MTTKVIRVRATKQQVKEKIRELVQNGLGQEFRSQLVYEYLKITVEAYDAKSEGGADQFGESWKPLSPSTIAARSITPQDRKDFRLGTTSRTRGLLTSGQDKKWRGIFYSKFKALAKFMPVEEAKMKAAQYAWAVLKSEGARTRLATLGGRKVPIMKDSMDLYESVQPGEISGENYIPSKNQQVNDDGKTITISSLVPHAGKAMSERPVFPPEEGVGMAIERALSNLIINLMVQQ